jgi:hypothetical protein
VAPASAAKAPAPAAAVDPNAVLAQLVGIKGVGRKTAEAAVEAFGADKVLDVLRNEPDRAREKLGARRAQPLIDGVASATTPPSENGKQKKSTTARKRAPRKTARTGSKRGRSGSGAPKS